MHDALAVGVPSVKVSVYDATNTVLQGFLETNPSGIAVLNLDPATYTIRLSGHLFTPDNATESLVVTVDAAVTYTGTLYAVAAPSDPALCRVFGYIRSADATLLEGKKIRFWKCYSTLALAQAARGKDAEE